MIIWQERESRFGTENYGLQSRNRTWGWISSEHPGEPAGFRYTYRAGESDAFQPGMVITDEPGIYIEGSHGVRLENELLVCEGEKNEYGEFLYFVTDYLCAI